MSKPTPGPPIDVLMGEVVRYTQLWDLTYIKKNAMHNKLLLMPLDYTVADAVDAAQNYCKEKAVKFSWLERAIETIGSKEKDNNDSNN